MAHGHSAKSLTVNIAGVTLATRGYTIDDTTKSVDVTSDGSGGYEEFAAGIEGGGGSARGFCDITTACTKPTAAVTATFFDGKHTIAKLILITKLSISPTVDGSSEVAIDFVRTAY